MPRVRIYGDKSIDEEQLKKLLQEAGCPVADGDGADEEVQGDDAAGEQDPEGAVAEGDADTTKVDEEEEVCEPDVLVVVLTPDVCSSEQLEDELKNAVNCGHRVVGIWPLGTGEGATLPEVFKKYGASEVPWDAGSAEAVICSGQAAHRAPSGAPRPAVKTDRNCC